MEGRWWAGKGLDIPLNHPGWFQCPTQNLQNPNLLTGTVADLIDHNTSVWKADLVRAVYPFPQCSEILSIPISKTGAVSDKFLWKHSSSGEYKVKNVYNLLLKDSTQTSHHHHGPTQFPPGVWNLIWKVNVPHKVGLFVWKLMHDCLLTYLTLRNRGISTTSSCPLYKKEDESTSHLFLYCTFARACWHGSALAIRTSYLRNSSVQLWISNNLFRYKQMDQDMMDYLQSHFHLSLDYLEPQESCDS